MTKDELLQAILIEAHTADAGDEDAAENTFRRIVELAEAALHERQPAEWALAGQPQEGEK